MGISTFPVPSAGGGGETNDFILDKNGTNNTTFSPGRSFAAGGYSVVVTGSTAYDIYLLDSTGSAVGYTSGTSVVAAGAFEEISALGLGTADIVSFTYNGPSTNASAIGDEPGAGAYLVSITPSDLPQIDDSAVVAGGNFASDVEVSFVSGTVTKAAKNVVVGSSTALVVTRPDDLVEDLAPYDLKAINPGVTAPSSSGLNVLSGTVTAGTDPSFITDRYIPGAISGSAFSTSIAVSDSEGSVVSWEVTSGSFPPGLTLGTADGSIGGTPTTDGDYVFTVTITDDGSNTASKEFDLPVGPVFTGVTGSTAIGGTVYAWATASDDIVYKNIDTFGSAVEYIHIAGGGGGGGGAYNSGVFESGSGAGGGAGGLLYGTATGLSIGTVTVTIGSGGAAATGSNTGSTGTNTIGFGTALAGGGGAGWYRSGLDGGSGGGGNLGGDTLDATQGNDGGNISPGGTKGNGGGGGKGAAGANASAPGGGNGGAGGDYGAWATAIGIIYDGGYFAGGGGGGCIGTGVPGNGGIGGGGTGAGETGVYPDATAGSANSGGGGGGGGSQGATLAAAGGSGLVILRIG